jgi:hypothetical protein
MFILRTHIQAANECTLHAPEHVNCSRRPFPVTIEQHTLGIYSAWRVEGSKKHFVGKMPDFFHAIGEHSRCLCHTEAPFLLLGALESKRRTSAGKRVFSMPFFYTSLKENRFENIVFLIFTTHEADTDGHQPDCRLLERISNACYQTSSPQATNAL